MFTGMYRDGEHVQMSYEKMASIPISRALYEKQAYAPPFDDLPTREEYEARDKESDIRRT